MMEQADQEYISLEEAQTRLRELIQRVQGDDCAVRITDGSSARAVVISDAYFQQLLDTVRFLRESGIGLADVAAGQTTPWVDFRDELLRKLDAEPPVRRRADTA